MSQEVLPISSSRRQPVLPLLVAGSLFCCGFCFFGFFFFFSLQEAASATSAFNLVCLQKDRAEVTDSVSRLVEWLEATMQHNPMPPLRNMAFWTLNHLLDALQVLHYPSIAVQCSFKAQVRKRLSVGANPASL